MNDDRILVKRDDLRFDPATDRMAQRVPENVVSESGECNWLCWHFPEYGVTVEYLNDEDVAGWKPLYVEE